jgi:hypothetical protein
MLVTFTCKAYADITLFGNVAVSLLRLMGHSGTVPGALLRTGIRRRLPVMRTVTARRTSPSSGCRSVPCR